MKVELQDFYDNNPKIKISWEWREEMEGSQNEISCRVGM